jgi:radical SAM-linked protein
MVRVRVTFAKTEAMRYIGNLDVFHTWERTFRRACLPLAYSQGFTPHARMQLAAPLPLGITGEAELLDVWLECDPGLPNIEAALLPALPPGFRLLDLQYIDLSAPPLQTQVRSAQFIATFSEPVEDLGVRVHILMVAENLLRQRRGKPYDLRLLIESLSELPPDSSGRNRLSMQLTAQEGRTGRPEEVISALGLLPEMARICRTGLLMAPSAV